MTESPDFAQRLRQAVYRERITNAAWRARRADDTALAWWQAADAVDRLIDEVDGRTAPAVEAQS